MREGALQDAKIESKCAEVIDTSYQDYVDDNLNVVVNEINPSSLFELGLRILSHLGALSVPHCFSRVSKNSKLGTWVAGVQQHSDASTHLLTTQDRMSNESRVPFCVEATNKVMERISRLLDALICWEPPEQKEEPLSEASLSVKTLNYEPTANLQIHKFNGTEAQRDTALLATLRLCRANLGRFVAMRSPQAQDTLSSSENGSTSKRSPRPVTYPFVAPLRRTIESLMRIDQGDTSLLPAVQMELAALVEDGVDLLYPSVTDVALLVERLLDQVQDGYFAMQEQQQLRRQQKNHKPRRRSKGGVDGSAGSNSYFDGVQVPLLEQLMHRLAQQGQHALFRAVVTHHDSEGRSLLQRIFSAVAAWEESLAVVHVEGVAVATATSEEGCSSREQL